MQKPAGPAQALAITTDTQDNAQIADNILDALAVQEAIEEELLLSVNALSGAEHPKTIRFRALVGNQVVLTLLDSGSTHSFIDSAVVPRIAAQTTQLPSPLSVKVANGETLACSSEVPALTWWLQGNTFTYHAKVVELGGYDIILGIDWLEQWGPMTCHWKKKWIEFQFQEKMVRLQGIQTTQQSELKEMSVDQVVKCYKGMTYGPLPFCFHKIRTNQKSLLPTFSSCCNPSLMCSKNPQACLLSEP